MSILLGILGQWKYAVYGVLVAGLVLGGWTANGWRLEAAQAKIVRAELRNEVERRVRADADRLALAKEILEGEGKTIENTRVVKERIYVRIKDNAGCDLVGLSGVLNRTRAGLPPAADGPDPATATP